MENNGQNKKVQNRKIKKKSKKKKFKVKMLIFFIIFELIFSVVTAPLIIIYGPFNNLKKTVVGTIMITRHQYFITTFLSTKQINSILGRDITQVSASSEQENADAVTAKYINDPTIIRHDLTASKYTGYLLEVKDPTRVKVAMTKYLGKEGQKTSEMASDHNAVAAINGGGFSDQSPDGKLWAGTGAYPTGIVMCDGKVVYGQPSNESALMGIDVAAITKGGKLIVGNYSLKRLKELDVTDALSFGPVLIVNGKKQFKNGDDGSQGLNPRTAIGQTANGTILLLVIDGRELPKVGASIKEVQDIMYQYGAVNAIELDGGSSATMYYNGEVINNPCNPLFERTVATSIYVTP